MLHEPNLTDELATVAFWPIAEHYSSICNVG